MYIVITATTNNHVLVTAIEVLVRVSCYDWIMLEKLNSQKRAQKRKRHMLELLFKSQTAVSCQLFYCKIIFDGQNKNQNAFSGVNSSLK